MDPDVALRLIRNLVADIQAERDPDEGDFDLAESGKELASAVSGLDEWLSRGGFPPRAWSTNRGGEST